MSIIFEGCLTITPHTAAAHVFGWQHRTTSNRLSEAKRGLRQFPLPLRELNGEPIVVVSELREFVKNLPRSSINSAATPAPAPAAVPAQVKRPVGRPTLLSRKLESQSVEKKGGV